MKIAEALLRRKELIREADTLSKQFSTSITVVDGVKPRRNAFAIEQKFFSCYAELEKLIININHTNNVTIVDGVSVMAMIARRDALKLMIPQFGTMLTKADQVVAAGQTKVSTTDNKGNYIKVDNPNQPIENLNTVVMEKSYNNMAAELRTLDLKLQALTWQVELIEL